MFFELAEVLYVVQFTCSTNDDHSDAVQALQYAVYARRVARAHTQLGCIEGQGLRRAHTVYVHGSTRLVDDSITTDVGRGRQSSTLIVTGFCHLANFFGSAIQAPLPASIARFAALVDISQRAATDAPSCALHAAHMSLKLTSSLSRSTNLNSALGSNVSSK